MMDAFHPAVEALKNAGSDSLVEGLKAASIQAQAGVENAKKYTAKFGRAKTPGEHAIGPQDAGATSVSIIFDSMFNWVSENLN